MSPYPIVFAVGFRATGCAHQTQHPVSPVDEVVVDAAGVVCKIQDWRIIV